MAEDTSEPFRRIDEPVETAKRLIGLKHAAYKDYLAARLLFLSNQLHQGAIFANTCIEKELKACLSGHSIQCKIKHDSYKILNLFKRHDPKTGNLINADFVKMISKVYESRYHEDLNPGYNFVLVRNKFLAELDYTFSLLEPKVRFQLRSVEGRPSKTLYELDSLNKNPIVVDDNYLYNNTSKEDFLNQEDFVHEFRMIFNHEVIEAMYVIPKNEELKRFVFEALKPVIGNNQSFTISNFHPGILNINFFRNGVLQSKEIT